MAENPRNNRQKRYISDTENIKRTTNHSHRKHHGRKCNIWQLITWAVLAVMLVAGAVVICMIKQVPVKYRAIVAVVLIVIGALAALYSFHRYHHRGRITVIVANCVLIALCTGIGVFGYFAYQDVKTVKPEAVQMKDDLKAVMQNLKDEDTASASANLNAVNSDNAALKETMSHPVWKIAAKVPKLGSQIESVNTITDIVDEASQKVMAPLITQMTNQPLSSLKVGDDGFNVTLINSYMDYIDSIKPVLADMNTKVQGLDLSLTGEQDTIDEYKTQFTNIMNVCDKYMPLFRVILGNGSDRNYLFMAQNLAEGRTNGGFPGSASVMRISNGVMTIGDFQSIYDLIPNHTAPADVAQTEEEYELFDNKMVNDWDANYTPDFNRAGQIWSRSYEDQNGEHIDGVISMTPSVIQDALKIFNTNITLSDGTVMDGTNAAKIMAYDLYYRYLGVYSGYSQSTGNEITNVLFAETASQAENVLISNFSVSKLPEYSELLSNAIDNGTFLVWMANADEEKTCINAGVSAILTTGKPSGDTGFYWSFDSACKMGWFMDLESSVGQAVANADGTYTYPITVTMKNNITSDDIANGSAYILGEYAGKIQGQMHITAPLGGKITDISVDDGTSLYEGTYEGLQMFYNNTTFVAPGATMTITYNVTLPQGIKDIKFHITPSYKNYR